MMKILTDSEKLDELVHFSNAFRINQRIIFSDEGNLQTPENVFDDFTEIKTAKPRGGVWFSLGRSWVAYLLVELTKEEDRRLWALKRLRQITHIYRLTITNSVLKIHTREKLDKFDNEYANKKRNIVDWKKVYKDYDGLEIRFDAVQDIEKDHWYDGGWDCSSGVVWRSTGIKKIELLKSWTPYWEMNH